jgi:hypothetical protein
MLDTVNRLTLLNRLTPTSSSFTDWLAGRRISATSVSFADLRSIYIKLPYEHVCAVYAESNEFYR